MRVKYKRESKEKEQLQNIYIENLGAMETKERTEGDFYKEKGHLLLLCCFISDQKSLVQRYSIYGHSLLKHCLLRKQDLV